MKFMSLERAHNALILTALKKGMTVEEVRNEIDLAIREAMADPDPLIQQRWKNIPKAGDVPTAEEVIAYVGSILEYEKGNLQ